MQAHPAPPVTPPRAQQQREQLREDRPIVIAEDAPRERVTPNRTAARGNDRSPARAYEEQPVAPVREKEQRGINTRLPLLDMEERRPGPPAYESGERLGERKNSDAMGLRGRVEAERGGRRGDRTSRAEVISLCLAFPVLFEQLIDLPFLSFSPNPKFLTSLSRNRSFCLHPSASTSR
jgi:hypothetical protein